MARSRNRKRKPYYSPSPGTFRPKERKDDPPATSDGASQPPADNNSDSTAATAAPIDLESLAPLAAARELKEEGNRRFQKKDYTGAMEQYDHALRLTPPGQPERAVFHSNKAACLMQLKPVQYDAVIHECTLALDVHPGFGRALLRRARAYEAVGKPDLALQDVQLLLQGDNNHPDALELVKRLRVSLGSGESAQRDLQGRPPTPVASSHGRTSVGASVVDVNADAGSTKSQVKNVADNSEQVARESDQMPNASIPTCQIDQRGFTAQPALPQLLAQDSVSKSSQINAHDDKLQQKGQLQGQMPPSTAAVQMRQLKLIYDHDIRLAELPIGCKFSNLRHLVKEKFPSSKAVLIKYKDLEGDLVTITSTKELRFAEAAAAVEALKKNLQGATNVASVQDQNASSENKEGQPVMGLPAVSFLEPLRFHVVEVPVEQEPLWEDEDDKEKISQSTQDPLSAGKDAAASPGGKGSGLTKDKEVEFEKWLLDFAALFRSHLGIDPDAHIDLHELGMELCSEALEDTATTEEAHTLFEQASGKFQTVAAQAFFNWGNVHMCAARKQVPHNPNDDTDFCDRLQAAFVWAQAQYALAEEKFEQALQVKPDFYEGSLALAQKDFETAKLCWSLAIAQQVDLNTWDSSETLSHFKCAEERMQKAAELLEKASEHGGKDVNHGLASKDDSVKVNIHLDGNDPHELSDTKTQVYLFWGNILYEHSQVEFRLGLMSWKQLLDAALQKFEVAGAAPTDVAIALEKHLSTSAVFPDTTAIETAKELKSESSGDDKVLEIQDALATAGAADLNISGDGKVLQTREALMTVDTRELDLPSDDKVLEMHEAATMATQELDLPGADKLLEIRDALATAGAEELHMSGDDKVLQTREALITVDTRELDLLSDDKVLRTHGAATMEIQDAVATGGAEELNTSGDDKVSQTREASMTVDTQELDPSSDDKVLETHEAATRAAQELDLPGDGKLLEIQDALATGSAEELNISGDDKLLQTHEALITVDTQELDLSSDDKVLETHEAATMAAQELDLPGDDKLLEIQGAPATGGAEELHISGGDKVLQTCEASMTVDTREHALPIDDKALETHEATTMAAQELDLPGDDKLLEVQDALATGGAEQLNISGDDKVAQTREVSMTVDTGEHALPSDEEVLETHKAATMAAQELDLLSDDKLLKTPETLATVDAQEIVTPDDIKVLDMHEPSTTTIDLQEIVTPDDIKVLDMHEPSTTTIDAQELDLPDNGKMLETSETLAAADPRDILTPDDIKVLDVHVASTTIDAQELDIPGDDKLLETPETLMTVDAQDILTPNDIEVLDMYEASRTIDAQVLNPSLEDKVLESCDTPATADVEEELKLLGEGEVLEHYEASADNQLELDSLNKQRMLELHGAPADEELDSVTEDMVLATPEASATADDQGPTLSCDEEELGTSEGAEILDMKCSDSAEEAPKILDTSESKQRDEVSGLACSDDLKDDSREIFLSDEQAVMKVDIRNLSVISECTKQESVIEKVDEAPKNLDVSNLESVSGSSVPNISVAEPLSQVQGDDQLSVGKAERTQDTEISVDISRDDKASTRSTVPDGEKNAKASDVISPDDISTLPEATLQLQGDGHSSGHKKAYQSQERTENKHVNRRNYAGVKDQIAPPKSLGKVHALIQSLERH